MGVDENLFQRFGKELPEGTVLFREGEPGREMYVLQAGRVAISKRVQDVEKVLATLGPGEFFGEMAIIANRPRNATAVVVEAAKLLVIDPKTFEGMVRGSSEIAVRLIKKLAERLAEADAQIETLLHTDPLSRVVQHLIQKSRAGGRLTPMGVELSFRTGEVAVALGLGEPAVRLALDKLVRMGLLEPRPPEAIAILELALLEDYLQYLGLRRKFGEP